VVPPFSRPVAVGDLPAKGMEVTIEANEAERFALAKDFNLPGIDRLVATLRLTGSGRGVRVQGEVQADVRQTCVVTLEPFETSLREPIDVRYSEDADPRSDEVVELSEEALDAPEPLVGGVIDLGALAAEFVVLGLDPYPRKPGVEFTFESKGDEDESPFAALSALKPKPESP
jgi:hypothetical protein